MGVEAIYLDCAATTPVDPRVAERMAAHLTAAGDFGNPASEQHVFGRRALAAAEAAREQVAAAIGAEPRELVFTSGATESNNLALKGAAGFQRDRGRHIVTAASEHKAVLDVCEALAFQGFEVTRVAPEVDGRVTPEAVAAALRDDTVLVSVMHANNETGVVNDIAAIGAAVHARGALYHVDAAQTGGRLPLGVGELPVDLLSLSAHKVYGPKGVGALWVRRRPRVRLVPQMHGGGHEHGLRSGTLPTHQLVGMGEAFALAQAGRDADRAHAEALRERLQAGLAGIDGLHENGAGAPRLPHVRNLAFDGVEGESLVSALADRVALATGSACTTASVEPSFV
ncbi:MAG: aminotransferase class V-fold PLP-dependent enzyme, partial [Halofilum sp. (in: g-proteobacteria)]|nr:aminotransferase class V-fold PLP-dependent enzyme [Halofilum sp. (in: g-proteobacteria)]